MNIEIERIYESEYQDDGIRILVDRLWPRGVSKENAKLDKWWKEIAPSSELRKWFDHDPEKWSEFKKRYTAELKDHSDEIDEFLKEIDQRKKIILLYAAKDEKHNQAMVLKQFLEKR